MHVLVILLHFVGGAQGSPLRSAAAHLALLPPPLMLLLLLLMQLLLLLLLLIILQLRPLGGGLRRAATGRAGRESVEGVGQSSEHEALTRYAIGFRRSLKSIGR